LRSPLWIYSAKKEKGKLEFFGCYWNDISPTCVDQQQDHGSFSIEVTVDQSGRISGKVAYQDHAAGLDFRTALITSALFNGNTVTVQGTGTASGNATDFQITFQDKDTGSGQDTFSIQLGTGYPKNGVVQEEPSRSTDKGKARHLNPKPLLYTRKISEGGRFVWQHRP
jgi:hypothetical protein